MSFVNIDVLFKIFVFFEIIYINVVYGIYRCGE